MRKGISRKGISRRQILQNGAGFGFAGSLAGSLAGMSFKPAFSATPPIRIGAIQSMSGHLAVYGQETLPVLEFMVRKINASGGIRSMGGARLELVVADTASNPAQASRETRRLILQEKVDLLIGGLIATELLAITGVIDEYQVPVISIFAGESPSSHGYCLGFDYDEGYAGTMCDAAAYLRDVHHLPIKTAVALNANEAGTQQIAKNIVRRLNELGIKVVAEMLLDMKSQDFLATMLKIRSAKPDLVIGLQFHTPFLGLMRARHQLKYYDSIFMGTLGNLDKRLRNDLGPEVASEVLPKGVFGMALYAPSARIDALQALAAELQGANGIGHKFGQFSIPAAQAMRVIQHALEMAGNKDKKAIHNAIAAVHLPTGHPDLYLSNPVFFGPNGTIPGNRPMIAQWSDDTVPEPIVILPEKYAGASPRIPPRE